MRVHEIGALALDGKAIRHPREAMRKGHPYCVWSECLITQPPS
jgi:hypothetical protein